MQHQPKAQRGPNQVRLTVESDSPSNCRYTRRRQNSVAACPRLVSLPIRPELYENDIDRARQQYLKHNSYKRHCRYHKRPISNLYRELKTLLSVKIDPIQANSSKICCLCREQLLNRSDIHKHFKTQHPGSKINATRGIVRENQNPVDFFFMGLPRSQYKPLKSSYDLALEGQHSKFFPKYISHSPISPLNDEFLHGITQEEQRRFDGITSVMACLRRAPREQGINYGSVTLFETVDGVCMPCFLPHRRSPRATAN